MNEATERIFELVDSIGQPAPLLFPLEKKEITVEIEIEDDDFKLTLAHKIKWPTLEALNERERAAPRENVVLSPTRVKTQSADNVMANAALWDKFRLEVKGYEWNGVSADQWVAVTPELEAEIPPEHKSEALMGMFAATFKVERPEGKGFVLGASSYRIKQTYGPYTIYHILAKHHERDRRDVAGKSQDTQYQTGTTQAKTVTFTNLKPFIQFYDKFFLGLEGVEGDDPNIAQRKDLVNALWKKGVVDALMDFFDASRRDLKKN